MAFESSLRGARLMVHTLGEFIHVSAIYLGLAVLTTFAMSLVVPAMRAQTQQVHEAVLAMFQADDAGIGVQDEGPTDDWSPPAPLPSVPPPPTPQAVSPKAPLPGAQPPSVARSAAGKGHAAAGPLTADNLNFARALVASQEGHAIAGATTAQLHALRSYLGRKYRIANVVAGALVRAAFVIGREHKMDPQLLLAVVAVESRYNPFAESAVGAQGLMQVMAKVHSKKLDESGGITSVFDPVVNMRVGAQILSECIKRRGSLQGGLACYVGAAGPDDSGYGARVLAERRRIALASGIPPTGG